MMHLLRIGALAAAATMLISAPARAASRDEIKRAVDRGVAYLKSLQTTGGTWPKHRLGATALAGLTLLECDVPVDDPAVEKAVRYVRQNSVEFSDAYTTYALSLAILFLERLGDPADETLIQGLAARVLAGQNPAGGWGYQCPQLSDEESTRLSSLIKQHAELVAKRELPKAEARGRLDRPALPPEIQRLVSRIEQLGPQLGDGLDRLFPVGDNSNTQFAVLALWAARRHGIPVENALSRTTLRFRSSQNGDGGWGYRPEGSGLTAGFGFGGSTPSMTCAGLLGVALGHGLASEAVLRTDSPAKAATANAARVPLDPARDPVVRKGIIALGACMARPVGQELQGLVPEGTIRNINTARDYYFLWSLERVAVAYGLSTIVRKDWYDWGASALLAAQRADGGWRGKHGEDVDTCFALLFLRRANLVRDLTMYLKGKVQDPGQATLKSGGSSGGELAQSNPPMTDSPSKQRKAASRKQSSTSPKSVSSPPLQVEPDAGKLSTELVQAAGRRQEEMIDKLEESKGVVYTEALAAAIPQLTGAAKSKAREALAQRLSRMTPATLRDKFLDDNPEVRRAAAHACTAKADKQFVPDLISLLADHEPSVMRVAHAALMNLTGEKFSADAADQWKAWWKNHRGK